MTDRRNGLTYADSGVDIDAGEALVERIKPLAKSTRRPGADAALGGFGGLFDLKACGFTDPVLVAANDGVGTKLKLAIDTGLHSGVGVDLVAMCINDLVVQGAQPLFFLDYFATGKLNVDEAEIVIAGIADGCRQAGCALLGGETAEMPGMYAKGDYDLAGFAVGAVERDAILPKTADMTEGDIVIALPSSGVHSNGFSLVRRLLELNGITYDAPLPYDSEKTVGQALIEPTKIYVRAVLALLGKVKAKGFAHITGGGITENAPRALTDGLDLEINLSSWKLPKLFGWLQGLGGIDPAEMLRTFNCGIGMIAIVAAEDADAALAALTDAGEAPFVVGRLAIGHGAPKVIYRGALEGA